MIRVHEVDSIETVTDFKAAADHGINLRKFQEMNLPVTLPARKNQPMGAIPKSVFEEDFDRTHLKAESEDNMRWKFKGPWLAGLTDSGLQDYLRKVRPRRGDFSIFLKKKLVLELNETAAQKALDRGEKPPAPVAWEDVTREQELNFMRELREDRPRLYNFVSLFLDLAPVVAPGQVVAQSWDSNHPNGITVKSSPYELEGPPRTHPSGGLSYLRTAAFLENHPFYGPQAKKTPVKARVVQPKLAQGNYGGAKLGVGGFVADAPGGASAFNLARSNTWARQAAVQGIDRFDTHTPGGAKVWVEAQSAHVNSNGQVVVKVGEVDKKAQLVAREMAGEEVDIFAKPEVPAGDEAGASRTRDLRMRQRQQSGKSIFGSSRTYGLDGLGGDVSGMDKDMY